MPRPRRSAAAAAAAVTAVAAIAAATAVASASLRAAAGPRHPAAAAAAPAARPSASTQASARAGGELITVTATTCAPGWQAPNPGRDHFRVANRSAKSGVIYLFHPVSGRIVATVRHSRPGRVARLTVTLRPGSYMWGCDLKGTPPRTSDAEVVPRDPSHGGPGPRVVPVTAQELAGPRRAYRAYARRLLARLPAQLGTLRADIAGGDLAAAQDAWLAAHLTWLELGQDDGGYGIFGNLGREIDGTAAGLVAGTADAHFTGFHKVELDLWRKHDLAAAGPDAAALARLAATAAAQLRRLAIPLSDVPLRCHEVLEDALRDTLSGNDDYGSGTGLASVLADVTVTRELLGLVATLVVPRSPRLIPAARAALSRLAATAAAGRAGGRWTTVTALSLTQREDIDGAIGAALETLAPVPDLLRLGNS
jgi:high-affinity iron transporter